MMTRMKLQIKKKHGQNNEKETPTKKFDNLERKTSRENFQGNQLVVLRYPLTERK